jgi:hypothetical protein
LQHRCEMEQKTNQSIGERVQAFPRRSYLYTTHIDCLLDKREQDTIQEWEQYHKYNPKQHGAHSHMHLLHSIVSNRKSICIIMTQ